MGGFPDPREQPRNLGFHARPWNRKSAALASISTASRYPPLNKVTSFRAAHRSSFCRGCGAILVLPFLSFQRFLSGELVALFSCVSTRQKENNDDANGSLRDSLAESETASTSATVGAGHEGLSNGPLFASGIDFHPNGIVLVHDI